MNYPNYQTQAQQNNLDNIPKPKIPPHLKNQSRDEKSNAEKLVEMGMDRDRDQ